MSENDIKPEEKPKDKPKEKPKEASPGQKKAESAGWTTEDKWKGQNPSSLLNGAQITHVAIEVLHCPISP